MSNNKNIAVLIILMTALTAMPMQLHAREVVIKIPRVEVYSLPTAGGSPVAQLKRGDKVRLIGRRGDWVKVEFNSGKKGWVQVKSGQKKASPARVEKKNMQTGAGKKSLASGTLKNSVLSAEQSPENALAGGGEASFGYGALPKLGDLGYSFGMGFVGSGFVYDLRFIHQTTRRLAMVGSFRHALGEAADSYFITVNWDYLLKTKGEWLPFLTTGFGVVNTTTANDIVQGNLSNMVVNSGIGVRKKLGRRTSLIINASFSSVFVGKGVRHWKGVTAGFMVGDFWKS